MPQNTAFIKKLAFITLLSATGIGAYWLAPPLFYDGLEIASITERGEQNTLPTLQKDAEEILPADLLQEWVALGKYLSSRPEFAHAKQVYLHRLSAMAMRDNTRLCLFLAVTLQDEPYKVLSPNCVLIGNEKTFSFNAEHTVAKSGDPKVILTPSADRATLQQINDIFSLYDQGLVQLSLHIIWCHLI